MTRKNKGWLLSIGAGALLLFIISACNVLSPEGSFGSGIDTTRGTVLGLQELFAHPEAYEGKNIIVEGSTGQVCQTSGCWIVVRQDSYQLLVQFYTFTVRPGTGTRVRAQGVLKIENNVPWIAGEGLELVR